jgi:hypothetical protein
MWVLLFAVATVFLWTCSSGWFLGWYEVTTCSLPG